LATIGVPVLGFSTPAQMLAEYEVDQPGCLILDLQLPQMNGLTLWHELRKRGGYHPCIIITGHGTIANAVEAIKSGAVDFLEKPFEHERLIARVRTALDQDAQERILRNRHEALQQKLSQLTPRERQVLDLVLEGKLSKQIARDLKITTKTVEVHRSNVTKKMEVGSVAQLFKRMNDHLSDLTKLTAHQDAGPLREPAVFGQVARSSFDKRSQDR